MANLNKRIVKEALSLPSDMRSALVDKLLESLNVPTQKEVDRLWAAEAEKRIKEITSGKATAIPGNRVFKGIRTKIMPQINPHITGRKP
jgi:putative addiction module component (TIGR02574 family)